MWSLHVQEAGLGGAFLAQGHSPRLRQMSTAHTGARRGCWGTGGAEPEPSDDRCSVNSESRLCSTPPPRSHTQKALTLAAEPSTLFIFLGGGSSFPVLIDFTTKNLLEFYWN